MLGKTEAKTGRQPVHSSKRLDSRLYRLTTGHCLTGKYLSWTKSRPTAQCWWCLCKT